MQERQGSIWNTLFGMLTDGRLCEVQTRQGAWKLTIVISVEAPDNNTLTGEIQVVDPDKMYYDSASEQFRRYPHWQASWPGEIPKLTLHDKDILTRLRPYNEKGTSLPQ